MPQLSIDAICMNTEPVPDWLIPDTLYRGSQILIAAMEGVGKSAFCYTLSNALATGSEFIGRVGPCRHASLNDATVFSGASCDAPRWPMISTGPARASRGRQIGRAHV